MHQVSALTNVRPIMAPLGPLYVVRREDDGEELMCSAGVTTATFVEPIRGGLAPWRIRRVTAHIEANLDTTVRTKDLAALVALSAFHFCRAFRDSFGDSPHGYVMRRRVERAQGLMLTTNTPLGQIAMDCGLADQAHFNRLFRRFVGESPGVWRRARAAVGHA